MQDRTVINWKTVLVWLSLGDLRHIMSKRILSMIVEGIPGVAISKKAEFLDGCFGMRITPKDIQKGMERIQQRTRIELFRPKVFERYVEFHQHASLTPALRELLNNEETAWEQLQQYVHTELIAANTKVSVLDKLNDQELLEAQKTIALAMMYGLVLFHEDIDTTERWMRKLGAIADNRYLVLEEVISGELLTYMHAKIQSDVRKTIGIRSHTAENTRDLMVERLQKENQEQKETIELLLSII